MKRVGLAGIVVGAVCAGCTSAGQTDSGIVMACFGVVNQNVPGQNQVVTNLYFGGCSPADFSGMQVLERATQQAVDDFTPVMNQCDQDCNKQLAAYVAAHPTQTLPKGDLVCQTLFATPCAGDGADVGNMSGDATLFQGGGPADERFSLSGTVTITIQGQAPVPIAASGLVDATLGNCSNGTPNCITISRLDVATLAGALPFTVNGIAFDSAEVQNQGLGTGARNPSANPPSTSLNPMEIEVSAVMDATQLPLEFHAQTQMLTEPGATLTLNQFFQSFTLTTPKTTQNTPMGPVTFQVALVMTGTPIGSPPIASLTSTLPQSNTLECTCAECTTASFFSTATDPDNDLQSLAWMLDNDLKGADGTSAPAELDLSVQMNFTNVANSTAANTHTVELVATDTRGATSAATSTFKVVDTTKPVINVPPAITLRSCDFPYIGFATATDLCDPNVVITNNQPTTFPNGTTTVTWTAQDSSLNSAMATQTVTVVSQTSQFACCPASYHQIDGTKLPYQQNSNGITVITGTAGNDCIIGTPNNDTIDGKGGNDIIWGNGGQDSITTHGGDDIIIAGGGTNTINSGDGNDQIYTSGGQSKITCGNGSDIVLTGDGDDVITCGDGSNVIYAHGGQDHITTGNGSSYIDGGIGDDMITCGNGGNTVVGGPGNDTITVSGGTNFLAGSDGDDMLHGSTGNDTFLGGAGSNTCFSNGGPDTFEDCQTIK